MGFLLAGMIIVGDWGSKAPIKAYAMPMHIMNIFIFDMTYTTVSRIASKKVANFREWLEFTGKDHLHHRLTALGLSTKDISFYLFSYCIAGYKCTGIEKRKGN
jgi:UDP-GlcNAc:undecaprenyl-phosphate GlcNAc-1-phosphate transferase